MQHELNDDRIQEACIQQQKNFYSKVILQWNRKKYSIIATVNS